jgi:septum formation protein
MAIAHRIYLASKSPRRRELLKQIGVNFELLLLREFPSARADVDETPHPNEPADEYVLRLAHDKAEIGAQRIRERHLPVLPVLSADTTVVLEEEILGKPRSVDEAIAMLTRLSGRTHRVCTGVAVANGQHVVSALSVTEVEFRTLVEQEIRNYVATGEPMDKAGAYAIQGKGAAFIAKISGSYSGVMGLPLYETVSLLKQVGFSVL